MLPHTKHRDNPRVNRLLWIAFVLLSAGVAVAVYYLGEIVRLPASSRPSDYYTALGELLLVAVLGIEGIIAALHLSQARSEAQEEKRRNLKEAIDAIFEVWWSDGMNEKRRYFFLEFLPKHWARLRRKDLSLKRIEDELEDDKGRIRDLTAFFDKVGWLGAADLIDVDFALGPMQHALRRVWLATKDFIIAERRGSGERFDPVYRLGFEWLARRSAIPDNHQANLLER